MCPQASRPHWLVPPLASAGLWLAWEGDVDREAAAGQGACLDGGAVGDGDGPDDGQAEAGAGGRR